MDKRLILIKLGGGVLTDKTERYGLRDEVLERLAEEIKSGIEESADTDFIIGNGAGSFAHWSAKEYRTAEGFVDGQSRVGMGWVRHDAVKLNQIVVEALLRVGVPAFSFSPSSLLRVDKGKTVEVFMGSLREALTKGVVPIVYGDVVVDATSGCGIYSTERVFAELAAALQKSYRRVEVIHVSSEDGVYVDEKVIPIITSENIDQLRGSLKGSAGVDVTGGMLHKVEESLAQAKQGIPAMIVSGLVPGRVEEAILGRKVVGTRIG